ncbi:hypothetical protein ACX3YD_29620 [Pseudomonas fluorescens group sp. PF-1]
MNEIIGRVFEALNKYGSRLGGESTLDEAANSGSTGQRELAIDLPSAPGYFPGMTSTVLRCQPSIITAIPHLAG